MAQKTNHNCGIHAAKIDIFGKLRNFLAIGYWPLAIRPGSSPASRRRQDLRFLRRRRCRGRGHLLRG